VDICESVLAHSLTGVLERLAENHRVVLKFTCGRRRGTGRLRVVRCVVGEAGELVLTVTREGLGGADDVPKETEPPAGRY